MIKLLVLMMAVSVFSQEFIASFTMTSTTMGTGQVSGLYYYSWNTAAIRIQFTNQKYNETFLYHPTFHNSTGASAFNTGDCNCAIGTITSPQPVFSPTSGSWVKAAAVDSTGCFKYDRVVTGTDPAYSVWFNSQNQVCQAYFSDTGRTFVFSNIRSATYNRNTDFPTPPGCICKTPLDIVIVLDRSGSVDTTEWVSEKKFAIDFSLSFEYPTSSGDSALKTNLAVVQFNTATWTTLTLATGNSLNNVNSTLQAMTCCANRNGNSCCNGFTSISSGIRLATEELKKSTRSTSNKAIVLITDGFHNTIWNGGQCYSCNVPDATQQMLDCVTSAGQSSGRANCLRDLTDAANNAYNSIPGVKIFTVAVGAIFSKPLQEFNILTKNDPTAQFNSADFTTLSNVLNSLTQSVCGATKSACDGCCGFCACGVCKEPDTCLPGPCLNAVKQGTCCQQTPVTCTDPNPCKVASCVVSGSTGQCQSSPYPCPAATPCYNFTCVNGQCVQNFVGVPRTPCQTAVCENNAIVQKDVCTPGNDKCVDYGCTNGICTATPKQFQNCFECDPATGLPRPKPCASENCFNTTCNPVTGNCEKVPISCIRDASDKCDTSYCEPATGVCVTRNTNALCVNSTNKCNYTTGCDKTTGRCIYNDVKCSPSRNCQDNVCAPLTGVCGLVNTSRCNVICQDQDCSNVSSVCLVRTCDPAATVANCDIVTNKTTSCIDAIKGDTCKSFIDCVDPIGCQYKINNCSTPPTNSCQYYVADSNHPGCCRTVDKVCGYDKCVNYKCDPANGQCSSTPVCPPSNACVQYKCNSADGSCAMSKTECVPPSNCHVFVECNNITGCRFAPKNCDLDKKNCTTGICTKGGGCFQQKTVCEDNNACTEDYCDEPTGGKCKFVKKDCDDYDACTIDSCNTTTGCVHKKINATEYCDDFNKCTEDTCDSKIGCVHKNITCNDKKNCTIDRCDRVLGCLYNPVVCNVTVPCTVAECNTTTGNCTLKPLVCVSNLELVVVASVSGGILAAIICAAIIGAVLFGGGSVALYNQVSNAANTMSVSNNPLYSAPTPGNNPLYTPA